jgi:hypothetical protein
MSKFYNALKAGLVTAALLFSVLAFAPANASAAREGCVGDGNCGTTSGGTQLVGKWQQLPEDPIIIIIIYDN